MHEAARWFVGLAALAALAAPSAASAAEGPVSGKSPGPWLVGDRAASHGSLSRTRPLFSMTHTVDARTDEVWYTARVKVRLEFEPGSTERGSARLLGAVNGKPGALVTLRAQPDGVRIFYDGFLTGTHITVTKESSITIDYENYVQTGAVTSGPTEFGIALEDRGRLVKEVLIDPLSGFAATTIPPHQLAIAAPKEISTRTGERFTVPYEVTSRGDRPDRPLQVSIEKAGGPLVLDNELTRYPSTGTKRTGEFTGVAAESGRYQLRLSAQGGYNPASAIVTVDVQPAARRAPGLAAVLTSGALIGLAAFAFLGGRRGPLRRRRAP